MCGKGLVVGVHPIVYKLLAGRIACGCPKISLSYASDRWEALQMIIKQDYDFLLVSPQALLQKGRSIIKKARRRNHDKPIIAISSRCKQKHRQRVIELGADGWVSTSATTATLKHLLEGFCNKA